MFVGTLQVLSALVFLSGVGLIARALWRRYSATYASSRDEYGDRRRGSAPAVPVDVPGISKRLLLASLLLILLGLGGCVTLSTAVEVPPTSIAVVENTLTGAFYQLPGGTHVWPFQPVLTPLVSRSYKYDLRRQIVEIGEPPPGAKAPEGKTLTQIYGVASTSDSPGQPVVYFHARGWAFVNPEKIVELHRRYGFDYLNNWVEQNWISQLKATQGKRPYDYAKSNRALLENAIETALQDQLLAEDGTSHLVDVSQLAIMDFDYEDRINKFLQEVAQKEFERQTATQQIEVNRKTQEAKTIEVETNFIVTKRTAEANKEKQIAEADGQAQAITTVANAQAEANKKVNQSLTEQLLSYEAIKKWVGKWPDFFSGGQNPFGVFFNTSIGASPAVTTTNPAPTK